MVKKNVGFVLFTLFLVSVAGRPNLILAADIYKCQLESGHFSFSDRPCENAEPELYYKGTEEDKKRSEEYQQQRAMKAQQAALQAVVEESRSHMGMLIKAGRIREAREHAAQNGLDNEFDGLVSDLLGNMIALQEQLSIQSQALTDRETVIDEQHRSLKSQDEDLRNLQSNLSMLEIDVSVCRSQLATRSICP